MVALAYLFLSLFFISVNAECGYESCPRGDANKLNVHLVPHTHNDVGWLKTVDQYYYGSNVTIQQGGVQYIIDSVIDQLLKDEKKKFIYVEMAFFTRWWREQDQQMQQQVKMLVDQGRLEFILGGWCMNDEASTHYTAMIDQMSLGLTWLNETFGKCGRPRVAWQIDPFGHSREQASIFAQMGFDGLFFGRLDYQDKLKREQERNMEGIWRASSNLPPPDADLFTGVNQNGYNPPTGFCFDEYCADQPIMDDPDLEDYNLIEKYELFIKTAAEQARHYKTNHIMWTMGSDFQYSNANMWFKNMDKIIKYVNKMSSNTTAFYSTPSCYLRALNDAAGMKWSVKTDDFFPYAERPHSFWTGYFTSRPALKGYVRDTNRLMQACTQLESSSSSASRGNSSASSMRLRKAMGVAQHHDAVSGTSKQHVADDYAKRLYRGREECKRVISDVLFDEVDSNKLVFCDHLNVSKCEFTTSHDRFVLVLYNPVSRQVEPYIRIPVKNQHRYRVSKISTSGDGGAGSSRQPVTSTITTNNDLLFQSTIGPLSTSFYEVLANKVEENEKLKNDEEIFEESTTDDEEKVVISNQFYRVEFSRSSGEMSRVVNLASGKSVELTSQNFYWYNSSVGNDDSFQQSGAYVFRPNSSQVFNCFSASPHDSSSSRIELRRERSEIHERVVQRMGGWCEQTVTLYKDKPYVQVEWQIGPIPIDDGLGKEVITRYDTTIKNGDLFYTDSNGREMLQRRRDFRPTWKLNQSEPVAGNYYPVNTRVWIEEPGHVRLTVLTDRTQGGASLSDGSLEIMLHRRVLGEDGKGVGESLNETADHRGLVVRGQHWLIIDTPTKSNQLHRLLAQELFLQPVIAFTTVDSVPKHVGLLSDSLPGNVNLLTLAPPYGSAKSSRTVVVRLEHQFEKNEDQFYSQPVTVNLQKILPYLEIKTVEELTLGANLRIDQIDRLKWAEERDRRKRDLTFLEWRSLSTEFQKTVKTFQKNLKEFELNLDVILQPMQIRTFFLKF